jgi:mono/diheme cytochrome c family protein
MGPMADVVFRSTQHLSEADLTAMAGYLKDLPDVPKTEEPARTRAPIRRDAGTMARGGKIYDQRCAYCHGDQGQGATGAYPPLAGNRAVNMAPPTNLIQVVAHGGFLPSTAGNPRPYGMPPFGQVLDADGRGGRAHLHPWLVGQRQRARHATGHHAALSRAKPRASENKCHAG